MIRTLLAKLGDPRPADWGYKVSVCVVARYLVRDGSDKLVCIADQRVSFGDFSGEHLTLKSTPISPGWAVLFAGNDVEHAQPIIVAAEKMAALAVKKYNRELEADEVAELVDQSYSAHLERQIANKHLRKHKFTSESFLNTGKTKCTPEVYLKTWDRISGEKLSLRFIVCGFDEARKAHIWLVDGEHAPTSYDTIGFWSIGRGAPAALSSIAFHISETKGFSSLEETVYVALTAKFMAETASDVGPSTFGVVLSHPDEKTPVIILRQAVIDGIRKLWKKSGRPRIPRSVPTQVGAWLEASRMYEEERDRENETKEKKAPAANAAVTASQET